MRQAKVTVSTSATLLATGSSVGGSAGEIHLQNVSAVDIYIGGSTVTTSGSTQGIKVVPSDAVFGPIKAKAGTDLYAIVASGTADMIVMEDDF